MVEVNNNIAKKANQTDLTALTGRVTTAEGAIDVINGSETTEGSIAKALKDAKGYADTKDGELHTDITKEINDAKTKLNAEIAKKANQADMTTALNGKVDQSAYDAKVVELEAADAAIEGRLDTIEGEGEGSIKKALADAKKYADDNFVKNGDFNTLQGKVTAAESDIDTIETALIKLMQELAQ